jgi:hypothetical protein
MSEPSNRIEVEDLWIERAANQLGFDWVASNLSNRTGTGPYLLIFVIVLIHIPLLSVIGFRETGTLSIIENPGELFQIPAWITAIWILLRVKGTYTETINKLPDPQDQDLQNVNIESRMTTRLLSALGVPQEPTTKLDAKLDVLTPKRLKYAILLAGWVIYGSQLMMNPSNLIAPVIELTGGAVASVRFLLIIPFILYPIGAELLAVIIGALVIFPFKIRRAGLVNFSDPKRFGGLISTGNLFKTVAVSYFVLLALFLMFETIAVGTDPTQFFSSTLIVGGLCVGLILFFAPMFWVKSYISAAKRSKLQTIAEATRAVGSTNDLLPYAEPESSADASRYTFNHIRMQRVEATKEFPINIGMIYEILVALVLPYLTSLSVDFILS